MSHAFDAATAPPDRAVEAPRVPGLLGVLDRAMEAVGRLPPGEARKNALQGLVGIHRGLCPGRRPTLR